jgi:hypothetical protein
MRRYFIATILFIIILVVAHSQPKPAPSFQPKEGYVPNAETAVKIAEAVLIPVYGEKEIISERPFKAVLADNIWRVSGTFHCDAARCFGGVAEVNISKKSGQILRMIHGM